MAVDGIQGMRIAILVTDGFEQVELVEPKKALEQAGAVTKVIAPKPGTVQGMHHAVKADEFPVDLTLEEADAGQFDAVLLPGGALNADALRVDQRAQQFVQTMNREEKPLAVICHGPWLLVSAGLVEGRTLTSYHTIQDDIRNAGGRWEDREVCRHGNWISSRAPKDIPAFNQAMIELFSEWRRGSQDRRAA